MITSLSAQSITTDNYPQLIKDAQILSEKGEYRNSGQKYKQAFELLGGKGLIKDRYDAAVNWSLANEKDSAFYELFKIANNGNYTDLIYICSDENLEYLHSDPRWNDVIEIITQNKANSERDFDKLIVAILDTVYHEDQKFRLQIKEIERKYGYDSEEMKRQWDLIAEKDSINLIKVKKILDQRGWLGPDLVGDRGNITLFLVIQHADLETQKKYLPMMRVAASTGNAIPANLALLEDRVALGEGKKQIYGSQIGRDLNTGELYILPLEDPDNVDKRREGVGLEKLQDYASRFGITWDVEDYKKKLSETQVEAKN